MNKRAIITGATKGIGRAIAIMLANEGYDIAFCARNTAEVNAFTAELEAKQIEVIGVAADCSIKADVDMLCQVIGARWESVSVLVNNAGVYLPGSLLDEPAEDMEKQLSVNLLSAYHLTRFFGKMMRAQRSGHIFNICSIASLTPPENAGSYAVTKSALLSLNNVTRQELSPYNVKVTAILPGATRTSSWDGVTDLPEKMVDPADIARMLFTVLSESAAANTEQIVIRPL